MLVPARCFARDRLIAGLAALGVDVVSSAAGIDVLVGDVDVVIAVPSDEWDAERLARAEQAVAVISMVIGTDNIDVGEATRRGILVAHGALPANYHAMAESVVLLTLSLLHRVKHKEAALRDGRWRPDRQGQLLWGATVGLIGFGRIGREVARRLAGWGVHLIAYDPYVGSEVLAEVGVRAAGLEELLRCSDVISVQVTLTDDTRGLIGGDELSLMKTTAYLVNISRGGVVDESALASALERGAVAGAAVDVWEQEPPPAGHPLLQLPDEVAVLTGHDIGHAEKTYDALVDLAVEQTRLCLMGATPLYVKNPEVLAAWPSHAEESANSTDTSA